MPEENESTQEDDAINQPKSPEKFVNLKCFVLNCKYLTKLHLM